MYDFNLRRLFFREIHVESAADSVQRLFKLPSENIDTNVYFVRLVLLDKNRSPVSTNFYWLPKTLSTYNWSVEDEQKHPYYTGITSYEDLSMLNQLKKVHLDASASIHRAAEGEEVRVQIHNPSSSLAFQVQLSVVNDESGEEILPVLWEDNYLSLMPGESRAVVAHYGSAAATAGRLRLEVTGWNVDAEVAPVGGTK
jgi:exo-1,4-beta-D-glucosaminidase